jgi:hypothetical protein
MEIAMKNLILSYLLLLISTLVSANEQRNCLLETKQKILRKDISIGNESIRQDDWYVQKFNQLSSGNTKLRILKSSLDDKTQSLSAVFENIDGADLTFSLTFSEGKNFLSIEINSANERKSIEKLFTIEENCSLSYTGSRNLMVGGS